VGAKAADGGTQSRVQGGSANSAKSAEVPQKGESPFLDL
jgi:hypothetical protein